MGRDEVWGEKEKIWAQIVEQANEKALLIPETIFTYVKFLNSRARHVRIHSKVEITYPPPDHKFQEMPVTLIIMAHMPRIH